MAVFAQGTPCWVDAQLPDLEGGKRFYGELFGWRFDPARDEALLRGRRVAGLVPKRDGRMPTTWTVYLAADDAGALAGRVKAAGGQMVMEPYPVGPFGVLALAADPGGAVFGLRQAGDDDGFEVTGEPGSFCWMEVYTRAPEAVDTFYASVFGWLGRQVLPGEAGKTEGFDYRVWSPPGSRAGDDTAFGGRAVITDAFPAEMPGHVLVYFAVDDCDEACATAVRLGGRVAEGPVDTPYGRIAVLHDNQGARFAVLAEPEADAGAGAEPGSAEERAAERPSGAEAGPAAEPETAQTVELRAVPAAGPGAEPDAAPAAGPDPGSQSASGSGPASGSQSASGSGPDTGAAPESDGTASDREESGA